jgi:hypothetical protein
LGNTAEDSDICERIRAVGWETHFVAKSYCVSIQQNTVSEFAKKELSRSRWESTKDYSLIRLIFDRSKWTLIRMGRNLIKGRLFFLPVDIAVWVMTIKIAFSRTLAARNKQEVRSLQADRHVD